MTSIFYYDPSSYCIICIPKAQKNLTTTTYFKGLIIVFNLRSLFIEAIYLIWNFLRTLQSWKTLLSIAANNALKTHISLANAFPLNWNHVLFITNIALYYLCHNNKLFGLRFIRSRQKAGAEHRDNIRVNPGTGRVKENNPKRIKLQISCLLCEWPFHYNIRSHPLSLA